MKNVRTERILALLLAMLMLLGCFVGCGTSDDVSKDQNDNYVENQQGNEDEVLSWDISEYSQFRKQEYLEEHYQKHVIDQEEFTEFGEITVDEYLMLAQWLIDFPGEDVQMKYEDDGDQLFYDAENNFFGVLSEDGYIRTFFRPTAGQDYFDRQ